MALDPDLLRDLLRQVEARRPNWGGGDPPLVGWTDDEIFEHIEALRDSGLVVAHIVPNGMDPRRIYAAHIEKLTPAGRAFLANLVNNTAWTRVKDQLKKRGADVTVALVVQLVTEAAKHYTGMA